MPTQFTLSPEKVTHFWSKVRLGDGCWEWQAGLSGSGYGLFATAYARSSPAHRVSWFLAYGLIPDGLCVCHHCDNKLCVRPDHLFLGTRTDNNQDMYRKRIHPWGERSGRATVTEADVLYIRASHPTKTFHELAAETGATYWAVWDIVRGRSWKHLL